MKKKIEFYLLKKQPNKDCLPVEWDNEMKCEICGKNGSYWIGENCSLCINCVHELSKFFLKSKKN